MTGCVVLHSGGLDSTILLCDAIHRFGTANVVALNIAYGQRHAIEAEASVEICNELGVRRYPFNLEAFANLVPVSALTNASLDIPDGAYTLASLKATVVPGRNSVFIALAGAAAAALGYDTVGCAVHAGDHAVYPDCRPSFIEAIRAMLRVSHFSPITLWTPFLNCSKGSIVSAAVRQGFNVPYELTYSCYKGGLAHCGVCATCIERKRAFEDAGIEDPTMYARVADELPKAERDLGDGPRPYVDIGYVDPDNAPTLEEENIPDDRDGGFDQDITG